MKKNIIKINLFLKLFVFFILFLLSIVSFPFLINFENKKNIYEEILSKAFNTNIKISSKIINVGAKTMDTDITRLLGIN